MKETLDRSSLGALALGDPVNLERAAMLSTRLGGHIVQGHVDGVGTIVAREPGRAVGDRHVHAAARSPGTSWRRARSRSTASRSPSPTVTDDTFSVSLIPTTLALTTLGHKGVGDPVNLEVDVIAKYVEKLAGRPRRE